MKAMSFQDDIPSIPIDKINDHYVLLFGLTSMQDATDNCYYSELVGKPLRLELNFTFRLRHVTELILLGEQMPSVVVNKFGFVREKSKMNNRSRLEIINRIPFFKNLHRDSFPTLDMFQLLIMTLLP